jgi:hypothetical protein
MEHLRTAVATLVGLIAILSLMAILAIGSRVTNPLCPSESCDDSVQCDIPRQPMPGPDAGKTPTPAPPRLIGLSTSDKTLPSPPLGQSVYVQVKTDHSDIEVDWASADFLGR